MATKRKTRKKTARRTAAKASRKTGSRAARTARARARQRSRPASARPKRTTAARKRAQRGQTRGLSLTQSTAGFTVNDINRSVTFYRDVLGFEVKERWEHEGELRGAEMRAGRVRLYLGQDDWKKGRDRVKGVGFRLYWETTQDLDALVARIKAAGGTLAEELESRPWGSRDFAVADPDGFKITISSPIAS